MPHIRNPPVFAAAIDVAIWLAEREEMRLMAVIESPRSSANQRLKALVELAVFSRQMVLKLTASIIQLPEE